MKQILIKYGGNAMFDESLQRAVVQSILRLKSDGYRVIVVHGGGPFIIKELENAGIQSTFIDGHRVTTSEAMHHVEVALKRVNSGLITLFNREGALAAGLSGKDAQLVVAEKREHVGADGKRQGLGRVGDVHHINTQFLKTLLDNHITPVIACVGTSASGEDLNINADMMAGFIAGEMHVDEYIVLTDIDGLREDVEKPETHIHQITAKYVAKLFGSSIKGGMIPKIESCLVALKKGARKTGIINGTKPQQLIKKLIHNEHVGTTILADDS